MDATITIRLTPDAAEFWTGAAERAGVKDVAELFQLIFDIGADDRARGLLEAVTPLVAALAL